MRILVLTRSAWRNDNSTGRTVSDIMSAFPDAEIYSLSMREQKMQNDISKENFIISEKQIIKRLLGKGTVGKRESASNILTSEKADIYDNDAVKSRKILWFFREFLWCVGGWKNKHLKKYIDDVKPDIIFSPIFPGCYPQKVLLYLKKLSGAKVAIFHMDDNYTLKRYSLSPLYWIFRFYMRGWVKKSTKCADIVYVISELQKREYEKCFKRECKLLTKSADFSVEPNIKNEYSKPLELIYTGNIALNRWKSLARIANVLEKINVDGVKAQLKIYTGNRVTEEMNVALNKENTSFVMGSVTADQVKEIQNRADVLVHIEPTDLKNRLLVRQSFSTKIVDYLAAARPILAFGPKDVASIDHLIKHDCAIVADNEDELYSNLIEVIENKNKLESLALKAYECGKKNHNKSDIDSMLIEDFGRLIKLKGV